MKPSATMAMLLEEHQLEPELVADRLPGMLDQTFLAEIGWDADRLLLQPPTDHPLLGWSQCVLPGCLVDTAAYGSLCTGCNKRLRASGMTREEFIADPLPKRGGGAYKWLVDEWVCQVNGCPRPISSRQTNICQSHAGGCRAVFGRVTRETIARYLKLPSTVALSPLGDCKVATCLRLAHYSGGLCRIHSGRWHDDLKADPDLNFEHWCRVEPGLVIGGLANLRGLDARVVTELLAGIQLRAQREMRTRYTYLNMIARDLRLQQVTTIFALDPPPRQQEVANLWRSYCLEIARALTSPEEEQRKDIWDLGVLGHRGRLDFTPISQRWLREIMKRWAAEDIPRRRGNGVGGVAGAHLNSVTELSEALRLGREDAGEHPKLLGRADIVAFSNRLAHKESTGAVTYSRRVQILRHVRAVIRDARDLGMTKPGGCAEGMAGEFALRQRDIPRTDYRNGPGRALPNEVMAVLDGALDSLEETFGRAARVAVELLMDTGRRPDEVCQLRCDCLDRDGDGKYVLIYTDYKENRLDRRLPIADNTAKLILEQQAVARAAFPDTPLTELALFPATYRNPDGKRSLRAATLGNFHRDWIDSLPPFQLTDGGVFPHEEVVAAVYRHTYAQRHADAGTPIDVLRELMGHRSTASTQVYYRITEKRGCEAVEQVAAHQFDGSGNRIWRETAKVLDSERARIRVGQISVPYGICVEPSNVQAGGGACPFRFRCLGCGHFRTDASYLPELRTHLDRLLADRERVMAATELTDWARAEATPSEEEITAMRALIRRIENHMDELSDDERAQIGEAVTVLRSTRRTVNLGMPTIHTDVRHIATRP